MAMVDGLDPVGVAAVPWFGPETCVPETNATVLRSSSVPIAGMPLLERTGLQLLQPHRVETALR